ncbi:hypothetical protein SEVIR_7G045700v4 [Setaria viridis]|uniref:Uncharacterized protein n=2 Tax=Setaria TaxID=4554 RepID=A0A368RR40_SETIT|nr:hypothetical protein SETIT_7G010100v2 [Setaria italica]TKW02950.1 hypothetical protein SEVIR_7G045700v2 [Setaria viridis]
MVCFEVHKLLLPLPLVRYRRRTAILLMIMCSLLSCSHAKPWSKSSGSDKDDCICPMDRSTTTFPLFKFSDDNRGCFVIPLQTIQEPSLFISPTIPPKGSLEPSGPTWTTITYSAIVLAMCKYILFAI